jgi:hypothetical protein
METKEEILIPAKEQLFGWINGDYGVEDLLRRFKPLMPSKYNGCCEFCLVSNLAKIKTTLPK